MNRENQLQLYQDFIANCTSNAKSVKNYSDFKRINECLEILLPEKQGISILDFDNPVEFEDVIGKLTVQKQFIDFEKKGGNQYSNTLKHYLRFLYAKSIFGKFDSEEDSIEPYVSYSFEELVNILKDYHIKYGSLSYYIFGLKYGESLKDINLSKLITSAGITDSMSKELSKAKRIYETIQEDNIDISIFHDSIRKTENKIKRTLNLPLQQIFYGAPGTGKSHEVKKQTGELSDSGEERDLPNVFRTTFHPDTDYASFVGCFKPTMKPTSKEEKTLTGKDEEIVYEFVPQAFTDAYVYAYTHSEEPTYLVIEEINRGNCAQIFGDLFQLLDRKDGVSEYKIKADKDLAQYLTSKLPQESEGIKDGKLCLPANLNILATMNTSDQSLFPMDSAFKRRWEWEYVPINYGAGIKSGSFEIKIGDKTYLWVDFIKEANKRIFDLTQSEDKQLGNFFIKHSVDEKEFKSKVMFYLWYEVLRDETENNKYFFYKKTTVDGKEELGKFIFKDLYEDGATQTLQQFMDYLGVSSK